MAVRSTSRSGLRRLGHPTALLARISTRGLGGIVRAHAARNDLDLSGCIDTDDQTTLAFASLDEAGRASYDFYVEGTADWGWTPAELATLPADTQVFHTGSLTTALSPGADVVLDRMERLHAQGHVLLSYDPNIRPALAGPREDAVRRVERFVAAAHVVKASDEDLAWLYPGHRPGPGGAPLVGPWPTPGRRHPRTRGLPRRDPVRRRGRTGQRSCRRGRHDRGGRLLRVGLLSGLVDAGATTPDLVDGLAESAVGDVLDRAVLTSAMTCQRAGADPPSRAEYDARRGAE